MNEKGHQCLNYSIERNKKKLSHLYFKVVVIEELLVHCLGVRVDSSQENSGGQKKIEHTHEQSTQRGSVLNKNKYYKREPGHERC